MIGWGVLLGAALEAGFGLLAEAGFGDEVRDLKERLTKRSEKAREAAFDRACDRAVQAAGEESLRPLLDHQPFREAVVTGLLDPEAGFDLKVLRADGTLRYVEVKGRSGAPAVELTENKWAQAANHRDRYWLYAVYHYDTVPQLYRVPDPFGRLLARQTGAVRIRASDVMAAAE